MIISHKYKFIFIKTHKTAGSSLEMALGKLCGEHDVVTHMETNLDTGVPRNYHSNERLGELYDRSKWVRKLISKHSPLLGQYYYEHMPAWRVKALVGDEIWSTYYKFCFERNPWDKVVSYYLWKAYGQQRKMPSFSDYVINKSHRLPVDSRLYFEGDQLLVDCVYEFRDLSDAVTDIRERLGIDVREPLPKEKTGIMPDRKPYQDYYDEKTRSQVARLFEKEIKLMGYTFD